MDEPNATCPPAFDPAAVLAALDALASERPSPAASPASEAARSEAWDAAWIACVTNSPRWADAARLAFARIEISG